jgi:hypothetical protein
MATLPTTSNYTLNSYGFGSGGTASTKTTTYALNGLSGELNGQPTSTTNNGGQPGFVQTEHANVPKLSDLDNNAGIYYNKLHFIIDNQNNPTDATFLISVSTDNFASVTDYLQPDGTLSTTLSTSDYQTYTAWGGSSGSFIIGLPITCVCGPPRVNSPSPPTDRSALRLPPARPLPSICKRVAARRPRIR